jgi:hypothetical protein
MGQSWVDAEASDARGAHRSKVQATYNDLLDAKIMLEEREQAAE